MDALQRSIDIDPKKFKLVQRIRVEESHEHPTVEALFRLAGPHVRDLCYRARYAEWETPPPLADVVAGTVGAVNLLRVAIIDDAHVAGRVKSASRLLVLQMHVAIEKGAWSQLASVYLPYQGGGSPFYTMATVSAILSSPTLHTIHLPAHFDARTIAVPLAVAGAEGKTPLCVGLRDCGSRCREIP